MFSSFDHSLTTQGSDLPFFTQEHSYNIITHEQNIICSKTHIDGTAYEQTSRPLFLGYMVAYEKEKNEYLNDIKAVFSWSTHRHLMADEVSLIKKVVNLIKVNN